MDDLPLTAAIATHLKAAFPTNTSKLLQRALGLTRGQAERIISKDRVPSPYVEAAVELLDKTFELQMADIERRQREIRNTRYELMAARQAIRTKALATGANAGDSAAAGPSQPGNQGVASGTIQPALRGGK